MPRHSVAQCDVQQSCTSRRPCALALDLRAPLRGGEGWTKRPAGGIGTDADSFSPGQEPPRKARPPLTDWPASPASAKRGCSFFWHCHHLGGYFSLGKQRKVTRPPAGGRKPAVPQGLPSGRNEPGRRIAKTKSQSHWTPAFAGVTAKERGDEARLPPNPHPSRPQPPQLLLARPERGGREQKQTPRRRRATSSWHPVSPGSHHPHHAFP